MTDRRALPVRLVRQSRSAAGLLFVLSTLFGCDTCGEGSAQVARLTERQGSNVQRDFAATREQWSTAEVGATFAIGDGVRTLADSRAELALADGSRLNVRPSTTIRFLVDGAGDEEQAIDLVTGEAILRSGAAALSLRTHVGLAQIDPRSEVLLTRVGAALVLQVDVGNARFRNASGDDTQLRPGEQVALEVGMAIVRRQPSAAEAEVAEPAPPAADAVQVNVVRPGARARKRDAEVWRDLSRGDHALSPGTQLRLGPEAELELARGPERARLLGAGEYIVSDSPLLLDAQRGNLRLIAGDRDVEVRVPGGRIVARAAAGGTEAELRVGEGEGVLDVKLGSATFAGPDGNYELQAGDQHRWSSTNEPRPVEESDTPPEYSNLEVRAGESFVIHAPEVPIAVTFDFSRQCKQRGVVELAQPRRRSTGERRANLLLPAGARGYTVRCLDARGRLGRVVARGSAHVLKDAGTRKLPLRAPTSIVDADGRSYTIYYQNQLPEVLVRWPNAPEASNYQLDVDGTVMSVKSPEHRFQSGRLRDGTHRLTFSAGDRRSRTANVEVRFDNTTATASLIAPLDRSFKAGDAVHIEGLALPAWNVSVRDGTIEKVGADRFQGQVVTSEARPDIAVRLAHPRLGTHYYLRRATGSQ